MGYTVFSVGGLAQVVRAGDSRRFKIDLKNDRNAIIADASVNALAGEIKLNTFHTTSLRGHLCVSYSDYSSALVLRSVARHLKRRLRVRMPDRSQAVRGVITSLLDATPMTVIRCDIKSFYETIPVAPVREKLLYDTASSALVRDYLRQYFDCHCASSTCGLPRGAGLSAILAELAIRPFDERVRAIRGVYRLFRYADDIIVFASGPPEPIMSQMKAALPKGMRFNKSKSFLVDLNAGPLGKGQPERPRKEIEYLGYLFSVEDASGNSRSRKLSVTIAPKKIKRLKSKIILSLHDYARSYDHKLLFDRLSFISSNYMVKKTGHTLTSGIDHIKSGIFYNYPLCGQYKVNSRSELIRTTTNLHELKALDGMFRSLVTGRRSEFKPHLRGHAPPGFCERLLSLSFSKGYTEKMLIRVTPSRVAEIKRAWRNV
ncbi:antiviral reverse transcriptase Drt3a [Gluconobacter oxydans]|uniref:antiviral reverse transcriptase Drt3a n=1 Tax=Gluconobacter oxydans TaxID=442 RepID=UPI00346452F4